MKLSTLGRHGKESFKNLARNGWMTFASISAVTVTLLLVGVFVVIMLNLNEFSKSLEEDVEVSVFIALDTEQTEIDNLQQTIERLSGVKSVEFSSKAEQLEQYSNSLGADGDVLFELFEQDNPLYDVLVVKAEDPQNTQAVANRISELDYVQEARYGDEKVERLFSVINTSRNVGIVLIVGLLFTAMFLISNTIKITIIARSQEIEIMRLVGATNTFIRWPFFLEGLLLGFLGSLVPILSIVLGYDALYNWLSPRIQGGFIELLPVSPFLIQVSLLLASLGAIIGVWGSVMSIRKFLKV
ncbi:permease-like cell division protein FtsX [Bacillus fonticola]|uniref:permease-like cell division protein FtsX n=1 Tax=Bacillus fonticola TaxID=2728853 RepID=UPI001473C7DF|nr:permease-like cell division protein FtsX [Bacillus fonticola]